MLSWLSDFFKPWVYVATVEAVTHLVDDEGNYTKGGTLRGYFILSEKAKGRWRRVREIGKCGTSPFANSIRAEVAAWEAGGPIPSGVTAPPAPTVKSKPEGKLIVLPGGKDKVGA